MAQRRPPGGTGGQQPPTVEQLTDRIYKKVNEVLNKVPADKQAEVVAGLIARLQAR